MSKVTPVCTIESGHTRDKALALLASCVHSGTVFATLIFGEPKDKESQYKKWISSKQSEMGESRKFVSLGDTANGGVLTWTCKEADALADIDVLKDIFNKIDGDVC